MHNKSQKFIVTHNGTFHADDIFGVSVLLGLFPQAKLVRTRDAKLIDIADFAVDVGGVWDADRGRFDHHQRSFSGRRPDREIHGEIVEGVGYASAGLVWKAHGQDYIRRVAASMDLEISDETAAEVHQSIDRSLVQFIDLVDTGKGDVSPGLFGLSSLLAQLNTSWIEERTLDAHELSQLQMERFLEGTHITRRFLDQVILKKIGQMQAMDIVRQAERLCDGRVLFLSDGGMPWTRVVVDEMPEVLFVIYRDSSDAQFQIRTVPIEMGSFKSRANLPQNWAGLRDDELSRVTGIQDAVFCHMNLFIGGAKSFESALSMARLALDEVSQKNTLS